MKTITVSSLSSSQVSAWFSRNTQKYFLSLFYLLLLELLKNQVLEFGLESLNQLSESGIGNGFRGQDSSFGLENLGSFGWSNSGASQKGNFDFEIGAFGEGKQNSWNFGLSGLSFGIGNSNSETFVLSELGNGKAITDFGLSETGNFGLDSLGSLDFGEGSSNFDISQFISSGAGGSSNFDFSQFIPTGNSGGSSNFDLSQFISSGNFGQSGNFGLSQFIPTGKSGKSGSVDFSQFIPTVKSHGSGSFNSSQFIPTGESGDFDLSKTLSNVKLWFKSILSYFWMNFALCYHLKWNLCLKTETYDAECRIQ